MGRFLRGLLPRREGLFWRLDLSDCYAARTSPQLLASLSLLSKFGMFTATTSCAAVPGPMPGIVWRFVWSAFDRSAVSAVSSGLVSASLLETSATRNALRDTPPCLYGLGHGLLFSVLERLFSCGALGANASMHGTTFSPHRVCSTGL